MDLNQYSSTELFALRTLVRSSEPKYPALRAYRKFWEDQIDLAIMDSKDSEEELNF